MTFRSCFSPNRTFSVIFGHPPRLAKPLTAPRMNLRRLRRFWVCSARSAREQRRVKPRHFATSVARATRTPGAPRLRPGPDSRSGMALCAANGGSVGSFPGFLKMASAAALPRLAAEEPFNMRLPFTLVVRDFVRKRARWRHESLETPRKDAQISLHSCEIDVTPFAQLCIPRAPNRCVQARDRGDHATKVGSKSIRQYDPNGSVVPATTVMLPRASRCLMAATRLRRRRGAASGIVERWRSRRGCSGDAGDALPTANATPAAARTFGRA